MRVIVVTGGIGSGKSEVCRIMSACGLELQYDADGRVKKLYADHPTLLEDIESELGCGLRDDAGSFVPAKLAAKIFDNPFALKTVENLVFPALIEDFKAFCDGNSGHENVIFESATILEKLQFDGFGDLIILVDAPIEERIHRACGRDGADRDKVLARIRNQKLMNALSEGHTDPRIDVVIKNDGTLEDLRQKTKAVADAIMKRS